MKHFKYYVKQVFYPIKNVQYFADYYQALVRYSDTDTFKHLISLLQIFFTLGALHFVYLGFCKQTQLGYAFHYDIFRVIVKPLLNLQAAYHQPMLSYFVYHLCVGFNWKLMTFLNGILVRRNVSFFLTPKYRNAPVHRHIRKYYCKVVNIVNSMAFSINGSNAYALLYFGLIFYQQRHYIWAHYSVLEILGKAIIFLLSIVGYWGWFIGLAHSQTLAFATMATLLRIFTIKMKQINASMECFIKAKTMNVSMYYYFKQKFLHTMSLFFETDKMYGKLFLACLITYCPCTIVQTMWVLHGELALLNRLIVINFISWHFQFEFAIHFTLTMCTKVIEKSSRLLLKIDAKSRALSSRRNLRYQMKLSNDIQSWYTTNKYGFRYGSQGLVSLGTFVKYLMLYGKIMMISYKLMKRQII